MSVFFELVGTNVVTIIKIRKAEYRIIRYSAFLKSGATSTKIKQYHEILCTKFYIIKVSQSTHLTDIINVYSCIHM